MKVGILLSCVYFFRVVVTQIDEVVLYDIRIGFVGGNVDQKRWYVIFVGLIYFFGIRTKLWKAVLLLVCLSQLIIDLKAKLSDY